MASSMVQHTGSMVLHHRRGDEDMRRHFSRTDSVPSQMSSSGPDSSSTTSRSSRSYQTQLSQYTAESGSTTGLSPPSRHNPQPPMPATRMFPDMLTSESPRASMESRISTPGGDEALCEDDDDEEIQFDLPPYAARPHEPTAIPATPSDFSELFPSRRKLEVRHDDTTADGNMNLVLNTRVATHDGRETNMTLFHLRMYDLKNREFSLRRYCRDSGREVCSVSRKAAKPLTPTRPGLQRSLSNALNTIRSRSSDKVPNLKRSDSGYGSTTAGSMERVETPRTGRDVANLKKNSRSATTPIKLEFSNYAQVEVRRLGRKVSKRYDFDYWGVHYSWKRVAQKHSDFPSFHLRKAGSDETLAFVVPTALSEAENWSELHKGGWVPPCSMWIQDEDIVQGQKDISDVIVATGLVAFVDAAIYAHFHSSGAVRLSFPGAAGPKRVLGDILKRRSSSYHSTSVERYRPSTRDR